MQINDNYLKIAIEAAREGGKIINEGFHENKDVLYKKYADPVTEYDKRSEEVIVNKLVSHFPDHGIITEEELSQNQSSNIKWIIDPIDGTVNFIYKIPFVAVSIALEINGEIVLGVVYNPVLNELFHAVKGQGSFLNDRAIHVSKNNIIEKSLLATGFPYEREGRVKDLLKPLPKIVNDYQGFRRLGSAALDLCYVACGKFDAYYEESLKPWDTAAGMIIVQEAGGRVTDYKNNDYSIYKNNILATNTVMHDNLLELLKDIHI